MFVGHSKVIVVHNLLLDRLDRDAAEVFFAQDIPKQTLDGIKIGFFPGQTDVTGDTGEGSFHAADVPSDVFCEKLDDFRLDGNSHGICLFGKDGDPRLQVGSLNIGNQTPLKP